MPVKDGFRFRSLKGRKPAQSIKDEDRLSDAALRHRAEYREKRATEIIHVVTREISGVKEYWNGEYWDTQETQAKEYKGQNAAICAKAKIIQRLAFGLHSTIHVRKKEPPIKSNFYIKNSLL